MQKINAMALLGIQYENGFFPGWLDLKTMQPMNHLNASPETSLSVTFLLKLYELTHKEEYKRAAFKAMNAVIHEIIRLGSGKTLKPIGLVLVTVRITW